MNSEIQLHPYNLFVLLLVLTIFFAFSSMIENAKNETISSSESFCKDFFGKAFVSYRYDTWGYYCIYGTINHTKEIEIHQLPNWYELSNGKKYADLVN